MVVDNKATVTYVQLLKEDLLVMRIVPIDGPVPDYDWVVRSLRTKMLWL